MKRTSESSFYKAKKQKTFAQQRSEAQARRIKRIIGVENKYYDAAVGFNAPASQDWSATEAMSTDEPRIIAGDDINQRNGRKISLTRVMFRGNITFTPQINDTAVRGAASGRLILVRNLNPNAVSTATQGEEVMGLSGGAFANVPTAIAGFQNTTTFGRYKIVDDQQLNFSVTAAVNNATGTTVSNTWEEKAVTLHYRPKKPIIIEYSATGSVTPNVNSFQILFNMDSIIGTPSLQGIIRFYYTDV